MEEMEFKCSSCSKEPSVEINVRRFIDKLDALYAKNDLAEAGKLLKYWADDARTLGDKCGLLSVLNETLGFSRRTMDKPLALSTIDEISALMEERKNLVSSATVFVNVATTLKHFNETERALPFFEQAEAIYMRYCMDSSYEYAALLNNRASAYLDKADGLSAETDYKRALAILEQMEGFEKEEAETLASLAQLSARKTPEDLSEADELLDKCWAKLTVESIPHDGAYAFSLTKCAPAFFDLGREDEGQILSDIAKEIYEGE